MDISTFERYFRLLYRPLGMYALRMLGDIASAEDVVQEAFAAAWVKVTQGTDIAAFKPYIYRAVHNAALMRLRRADNNTVSIDELGTERVEDEAAPVTDADMELAERDARLWETVGRLPARCRQVLLMCKRDGMSYREVAEEMGISVKTVENQMNKALRTLRESLGPEHESDRRLMMLLFF